MPLLNKENQLGKGFMLASVHPIQEIPDRPYLKPTFDFLLVVVLNDDNKGTNLRVLKRKGSLNVTTNAMGSDF